MDYAQAGALLREVTRLHATHQRDTIACCGGTSASECQIITELGRNGPVTLMELARRLDVDKGWVSRVAESLAQEELLEKVPGKIDRRTVVITLTASGQQKFQELNGALNLHSASVLGRIPVQEQAGVARALALLKAALQGEDCCAPALVQLNEEA